MSPRYVQDEKHLNIDLNLQVGDEITFSRHDDGSLDIRIEEPWAGSTETGFGQTSHATLTREDVKRLLEWLERKAALLPTEDE